MERHTKTAAAVVALWCSRGSADDQPKAPESPRLVWRGDLRLRSDLVMFSQEVDEQPTDYRGRFRLRLGVERQFDNSLVFGARVATGSANPTSGNVTFGDVFGKKAIAIDRVFLAYRPVPWFRVVGGKMDNPLFDRDLLWDGDVGPEGLAEQLSLRGDAFEVTATAAQFVLEDLDETSSDPWLYAGQLLAKARRACLEVEAGVAYYHYTHLDEAPLPYAQGTNSHDMDGVLTVDFHVLAALVAMRMATAWWPITAHVEVSENLAVDDAGRGLLAEARVGQNASPLDLSIGYAFQRLERDATLDSLAESHWHKQRTNYSGHALNAKLSLRAYWIVSTSLKWMTSIDGPRDDEFRWTLDTIVVL